MKPADNDFLIDNFPQLEKWIENHSLRKLQISDRFLYYHIENDYAEMVIPEIGSHSVLHEAITAFQVMGIRYLGISLNDNTLTADSMLQQAGFRMEFDEYLMESRSSPDFVPAIEWMQYDDGWFEREISAEGLAFESVRRDNNQSPVNWFDSATAEELSGHRRFLSENAKSFFLFPDGQNLIGGSFVKDGEIRFLFVAKDYQGKGFGKSIALFSVRNAFDVGAKKVGLMVFGKNPRAIACYRSCGFVVKTHLYQYRMTIQA